MSKEPKNKSPKEASSIFHNIMKASVKGNPKPQKKNYDFTERIGDKQFHFRKDNETKYSVWEVPITGISFFAERNGDGHWIVYGTIYDTKIDTAIKKHEEAKKK